MLKLKEPNPKTNMTLQASDDILTPERYLRRLRTHTDFLGRLPKNELPDQPYLKRRIAAGAFRSYVEKRPKANDLEANLFKLVRGLDRFYRDSRTLDYLRHHYGRPQNMSPHDKDRFYDSKDTIINFNDTLVDVIGAGAERFDFDELLAFMTNVFSALSGGHHVRDFEERAREAIVGMRNETAVEQLLTAGGVEFRRGSIKEDSKGGDYFIDGIPFDFKSNEMSAERARMKAEEGGYDGGTILWSHVHSEDFEGKLALPQAKRQAIFAELKPELDAAIQAHKHPQTAHAI